MLDALEKPMTAMWNQMEQSLEQFSLWVLNNILNERGEKNNNKPVVYSGQCHHRQATVSGWSTQTAAVFLVLFTAHALTEWEKSGRQGEQRLALENKYLYSWQSNRSIHERCAVRGFRQHVVRVEGWGRSQGGGQMELKSVYHPVSMSGRQMEAPLSAQRP